MTPMTSTINPLLTLLKPLIISYKLESDFQKHSIHFPLWPNGCHWRYEQQGYHNLALVNQKINTNNRFS